MLLSKSLQALMALCILASLSVAFMPVPQFGAALFPQHIARCRSVNLRSSLRAQLDKTSNSADTALGWIGRPATAINDAAKPRQPEIRTSMSGDLQLDGASIRYDYLPGDSPAIMFLPALNQTRHGAKASAIKTWCRRFDRCMKFRSYIFDEVLIGRTGRAFLVADYFGMGQSSGEFKDACISRWSRDTAALLDWLKKEHAHSEAILVGAGVGGWVMLLAAQMRPQSITGLVGVAADPDFTEAVVLPALSEEVKSRIEREGVAEIEWGGKPYTLSKRLLEDGRDMLLLNRGPGSIDVTCPVRLIQGLGDEEIPPERQLQLSDAIKGRDVVITYVKAGSHALDEDEDDFRRIYKCIEEVERSNARASWMASMNQPA